VVLIGDHCSGSFAVRFGDHFGSGDHLRLGSFAVLYSSLSAFPLADLCSSVILVPILVKCIDLVVNEKYMSYVVPPLSPGLLTNGLNGWFAGSRHQK